MDWNKLTDDERLVAERAVAMARTVKMAGDTAPFGRGLACMEQAVLTEGMELQRIMLERLLSARPEAQKKGSPGRHANAGTNRDTRGCGRVTC